MKTDSVDPEALAVAGPRRQDLAATDSNQAIIIRKMIVWLQTSEREAQVCRCIVARSMEQEGLMEPLINLGQRAAQQRDESARLVDFQPITRVLPNGRPTETGVLGVGTFHWKHLHAIVRLRPTGDETQPGIEIASLADPEWNEADPQELPRWLLETFRFEMVRAYLRHLKQRACVGEDK